MTSLGCPTNSEQKKVAAHTLGCRLNATETAKLLDGFVARGFQVVPFGQSADYVLINTCTVTNNADSTSRNFIRRAHRDNPVAKIIVVGCYAQLAAEEIAKMDGVTLVLGTAEKNKVFDYLEVQEGKNIHTAMSDVFWSAATTTADNHTRGFLKIQDGCNYYCAYCIVPYARGNPRSMKVEDALAECHTMVQDGFKEIVLTGVNIGEYKELTFLLGGMAKIEGLRRIRLSSVEPNTVSDELLQLWQSSDQFMPHFHLPLQSGDDQILKAMRRRYSTADYARTVEKIKKYLPHAGIGIDVIVGFPGESEAHFENTFNFMAQLPLTHYHVFPYSPKKGTRAAGMKEQVRGDIKKERTSRLAVQGQKKLLNFMKENLLSVQDVLFEQKNGAGDWEGYTPNFLNVTISSPLDLKNQIKRVKLESIHDFQIYGVLVD